MVKHPVTNSVNHLCACRLIFSYIKIKIISLVLSCTMDAHNLSSLMEGLNIVVNSLKSNEEYYFLNIFTIMIKHCDTVLFLLKDQIYLPDPSWRSILLLKWYLNRRTFNNFSSWPKLSHPAPSLWQPARLRLTLSTWYNTIYMCNRFLSKDQFTFFLQTLSTRSKTISICYRFFINTYLKTKLCFSSNFIYLI